MMFKLSITETIITNKYTLLTQIVLILAECLGQQTEPQTEKD